MTSFFNSPRFQALDGNGNPLAGAKLYTYTAGTTTLVSTFQDSGLSSAHANPVVADAGGYFPAIYMSAGNYKFILHTSADTVVWAQDNISPPLSADGGVVPVANGGTGSTTAATARTALGAAGQADLDTFSATLSDIDNELTNIGGALGAVAALESVAATNLTGIKNVVLQEVSTETATQTSLANTITGTPSNTSGASMMSVDITPTRDDTTIEVLSEMHFSGSGSKACGIAFLCRSDSAAVLDIVAGEVENHFTTVNARGTFQPGSTNTVTVSVRAGRINSNSVTFNTSYIGGVTSRLIVRELYST